jgi:hypothetical protein
MNWIGVLDPHRLRGQGVLPSLPVLGTPADLPRLTEQQGSRRLSSPQAFSPGRH